MVCSFGLIYAILPFPISALGLSPTSLWVTDPGLSPTDVGVTDLQGRGRADEGFWLLSLISALGLSPTDVGVTDPGLSPTGVGVTDPQSWGRADMGCWTEGGGWGGRLAAPMVATMVASSETHWALRREASSDLPQQLPLPCTVLTGK